MENSILNIKRVPMAISLLCLIIFSTSCKTTKMQGLLLAEKQLYKCDRNCKSYFLQ